MKNKVELVEVDFMANQDNVYRTKHYIVSQKISIVKNKYGDCYSVSNDRFYVRNEKRDYLYETIFLGKTNINGRRLPTLVSTRNYIE